MSVASFPRAEHVALLRQKIEERLRERNLSLEVTECGLNQYRCQYRFGVRRQRTEEWTEISIHFQVAERLETGQNDAELNRMLDDFLDQHFS